MKKLYFTKEEKKEARKKWNRTAYEKRKKLIQIARRAILEQQKKESLTAL